MYGPDLGNLKGKTVTCPGAETTDRPNPLPDEIMSNHRGITICMDIMYINRVALLVMVSKHIGVGTMEYLPNRQGATIACAARCVTSMYRQRGFEVISIKADPEFWVVDNVAPDLPFDYAAQDKHMLTIEWYIQTVKDRIRSCYMTLPFTWIPRIMIIHLATNAIFWLNALPHLNGVSSYIK